MTFSIAARCPDTGHLGVGAITAMMGVGKLVSHARAGVGASATQANINPYLALDGLRHVADGLDAQTAIEKVIDVDPGRDYRQVGLVDVAGRSAAWSGRETPDWTGHITGESFSTQGNRLVGRETLEAVVDSFASTAGEPLVERLMRCLEAGEATGADTKGALSGTLYVVDTEEYPLWDVRVDHADDPAAQLRALYGDMAEQLVPQVRKLSTRNDMLGELTREQMHQQDE